jgi:dTDP-4-amino-4,6-dideoxygalactose transaminase
MTYWLKDERIALSAFPEADRYFERALSLPLYPDMREADVDVVVSVLQEALDPR